jgi:hypothetical protein
LLLPEHAKRKRQASVRGCTKSARRRFRTQDVGYLERHLTTPPHETLCTDEQKQRREWTKQDTTSLAVSMEAVFITAVVNAYKEHDVACFDIPGAFLHADSDKKITMILNGRLAELMVQVTPNHTSVDRKGMAILYIKMQKAIYGLLRSTLLFYKKLVANLESIGFKLNPYDPCVANKEVNGTQITVCWHVDDLKVSPVDPKETQGSETG